MCDRRKHIGKCVADGIARRSRNTRSACCFRSSFSGVRIENIRPFTSTFPTVIHAVTKSSYLFWVSPFIIITDLDKAEMLKACCSNTCGFDASRVLLASVMASISIVNNTCLAIEAA